MKLKYLKMICYITFIFLTINFILGMNYTNCINGYAFLWMLLIASLIYSEINFSLIMTILSDIILFIPVLFVDGIVCRIGLIIAGVLIISLQKKIKADINYDQALYQIKIMFPAAIVFIIISFMATDSSNVNEYIIPYAILYIVFSIILLRTMRNYKYNVVNKKIRKINTVYLIIIMAFSAVISVSQVRNVIVYGMSILYKGISYLLYKIACFISYYLFKIFGSIHISQETEDKFFKLYNQAFGNSVKEKKVPVQPESQSFWAQHGIAIIVNIIIAAVIIYILYKVIKVQYNKKKVSEDYIEKRESVISTDKKKFKRNIYSLLKKGSYKDRIRYYYYSLLKDCWKKNIRIVSSDTTKEINDKAESSFDKKCLSNMRQIYLKAKYTDNQCTSEDFNDFHRNYKEK